MVQLQIISQILTSKDLSIVTDNNLTKDYFTEYSEEFQYIIDHYETYKTIPDIQTFLSEFNDIELVEVNEPARYLVDKIREDRIKQIIKKIFYSKFHY